MTEHTPGPLKVGVCLHCLDHWTAEDWQAMSQRIRESEERLREQIRQEHLRLGLRVGKVQADTDERSIMPQAMVIQDNQIRTLVVMATKDYDGDVGDILARDTAEIYLRENGDLGGWGGDWYFSGTQRTNYNTVEVIFRL